MRESGCEFGSFELLSGPLWEKIRCRVFTIALTSKECFNEKDILVLQIKSIATRTVQSELSVAELNQEALLSKKLTGR